MKSTSRTKSSKFALKIENKRAWKLQKCIFYDGLDQKIGYIFFGPLYEEELPLQTIPEGYQLVGMSITMESVKF